MTQPLRPILDVAADCGLAVEPRGAEWAAYCPNHDDRNQSLFINPAKGVWTCFGCSVGGGAAALARFLGHDPAIALDPEAESQPLAPPNIRLPRAHELGPRFCALSTLVRRGLVDPQLLRDLDAAAVSGDDVQVEALLSTIENRVLTGSRQSSMV